MTAALAWRPSGASQSRSATKTVALRATYDDRAAPRVVARGGRISGIATKTVALQVTTRRRSSAWRSRALGGTR